MQVARLAYFNIGHDYLDGAFSGSVGVNLINDTLLLNLSVAMDLVCPEMEACSFPIQAKNIELPLVDIYYDACGALVYKAQLDKRPVDGMLEIIEVTDKSTMLCDIFISEDTVTDVVYKSETLLSQKPAESHFSGHQLHEVD